MNRNHALISHLLYDTSGADLVEYGLIGLALILTAAAAAAPTTARLVAEINILAVLVATCSLTALIGFILPLSAAVKGD